MLGWKYFNINWNLLLFRLPFSRKTEVYWLQNRKSLKLEWLFFSCFLRWNWRPLSLKSCHFEASRDIITKSKSQALHIIRIKYWKASGSGIPPSLSHTRPPENCLFSLMPGSSHVRHVSKLEILIELYLLLNTLHYCFGKTS